MITTNNIIATVLDMMLVTTAGVISITTTALINTVTMASSSRSPLRYHTWDARSVPGAPEESGAAPLEDQPSLRSNYSALAKRQKKNNVG